MHAEACLNSPIPRLARAIDAEASLRVLVAFSSQSAVFGYLGRAKRPGRYGQGGEASKHPPDARCEALPGNASPAALPPKRSCHGRAVQGSVTRQSHVTSFSSVHLKAHTCQLPKKLCIKTSLDRRGSFRFYVFRLFSQVLKKPTPKSP